MSIMRKKTLILLGTLSAILVAGFGCSGAKVDESDPAALYKEAEEEIKSDHYQIAIDKLRVIKNKFHYSKYSIDAQLRIADVYFLQETYAEAATAYETFRDLHPKHEKTPYAMFRMGLSHFNDIPSPIARDLTPGQKAIDAFNEFLKKYPQAPEAAEAKEKVQEARKLLAEKELYIANFYYRGDDYSSAKTRYAKILDLYPETESAAKAKERLVKIEKNKP